MAGDGTAAGSRHGARPSRPVQIAASVLPTDVARLGDAVAALEAAGVDRVQWDVMEGRSCPT